MMRFWIWDSYLYPWGGRRALWLADRFTHVIRHLSRYLVGTTPMRQPFDKVKPRSSRNWSLKIQENSPFESRKRNLFVRGAITDKYHLNKQDPRHHGIPSQREIVLYKETQNRKVHQNMKFQIKSITVEIILFFSYFFEIFRWVLVLTGKEMWKLRSTQLKERSSMRNLDQILFHYLAKWLREIINC